MKPKLDYNGLPYDIRGNNMSKGARVKCLDCGTIIQSMHVHDYQACPCYLESTEKVVRCTDILNERLGLDEWQYHIARLYLSNEFGTGITVDGGSEYLLVRGCQNTEYEILDTN